jgi:prepilin-type N-terminal cleavage/methylation domain-containing protein
MKKMRLSNKIRKTLRGSSTGFTLVEVLVALVLFAIIGIVFASGLGTASKAVFLADVRTNAESLARTQMEFVKNPSQDYDDDVPDGGVANYTKISVSEIREGYTIWSVNRNGEIVNGGASDPVIGIPWDSGNNTAVNEDNGLQKITLVIKHEGDQVITLEGYKVDR